MAAKTRRKRCDSSGSPAVQSSPLVRDRLRPRDAPAKQCETPRPHKRVRFSDFRPKPQNVPDYSTGLTPALNRTSFEERDDASQRTPSRASRRHSAPLSRYCRTPDSPMPLGSMPEEKVLHFTPLRQLLDRRTQRRIRRIGLSDEINNLEREKRSTAQYEKSIEGLLHERNLLRQELEAAKKERSLSASQVSSDDGSWMATQDCIRHLECGNDRLRAQLSISGFSNDQPPTPQSETGTVDTLIINDSGFDGDTMFMSDSPDLRATDINHSVPDDFSLSQNQTGIDASAQTSSDHDPEFLALSRDLKAAEEAKRTLFEACRSRLQEFEGTTLERHLHNHSPPPEFLDDILSTLMQTISRASDATQTLSDIHKEISTLGFEGENAEESVGELQSQLRAARLELERILPGETANAGLNDGMSTLGALVKRVETLVKDLGEEQTRHEGSADRERALRGQFDLLLTRYETASKKIEDLEESISSSAGDMLHTRMQMQEMEREAEERNVGIDRLNAALSKYHDEVKGLEDLVTRLEDEKAQACKDHTRQVSELKQKLSDEETSRQASDQLAAEMGKHLHELEETIEQNRIQVCDLTAKVETLERQHSEAVANLEKNTEEHEQEVGLLNVRVAELNTALEAAKAEAAKLSRTNTGLEEQLRLEMENRDGLLDTWVEEQTRAFAAMKAAVSSQRRKAKARAANWELKSDELLSTPSSIGPESEPITPISMTRFVDVEVGRGKQRRRLDSGIGVLTSDELTEDVDEHGDVHVDVVPSDPVDL
ncbi:hypothetical protein BDW69DRAFT_158620 [Aspergillus filifer]